MAVTFPLFELLPEDERQRKISKLKMEKYRSGSAIFERGGDCTDTFFVFEGRIRIDTSNADGDTAFFYHRHPGQMIGWWASVTGMPHPNTATAVGDVVLGRLAAAEFMELVLGRRELSAWMLKFATSTLRAESNRIRYLTIMDAARRVAAGLLEYRTESGNTVVEVPERDELASRLGMTRETLARNLSDLQKRGLIKVSGQKIQILQLNKLIEFTE